MACKVARRSLCGIAAKAVTHLWRCAAAFLCDVLDVRKYLSVSLRLPVQHKARPLGEGDRRQAVEGFCGIFCVMCEVLRKNPSVSLRLPAPFSREPECQKASLEKGGGPSQTVEGFLWNLLLDVRGFTEESLSQPAVTAQHKARPAGALSREPECQKASLEKGGGPSQTVEGFFM